MHCKEQRRIISEIYMFIFQSKFNNPPYGDHITEKKWTSKKNKWDFQISKVGSLDFLNLKVNGSPVGTNMKLCFIEMLHCGIQHYIIFSVPDRPYHRPRIYGFWCTHTTNDNPLIIITIVNTGVSFLILFL